MLMWWEHPVVLGVGALAILIAGVATIWGKGIVPTYRGVMRFFRALRKFADSIDILFDIAKEFKPNGGHSLHDRITRMEKGQESLAEDMAGVKLDVAEVKRQVEQVITEELAVLNVLTEQFLDVGEDG